MDIVPPDRPRNRLREERVQRRWRQRDVADQLGTSIVTIKRWERGTQQPHAYFRLKLCALFGKSVEELGLLPQNDTHRLETPPEPPPFLCDPLIPLTQQSASPLVGRGDAFQQTLVSLCTSPHPSFALVGLPGVGKTSLALALAQHPQICRQFPDGILWVGLGPTPPQSETLSRWGTLLGLPLSHLQDLSTPDAWARALHVFLNQRRMLLILDDAWTLADATFFRIGGPQCAHLLTTRSPLLAHTFAGEYVLHLHELTESESLTLLHHIAPRVTREQVVHLQRLIRLVGGLPLALTLLGRHLQAQALSGPSRRLSQTLDLLCTSMQTRFSVGEPHPSWSTPSPTLLGTTRSLQYAIDLSVHALPISAQEALTALALFSPKPETFSEEAACAVGQCELATLDLLIDSGLVACAGADRYTIHQTIADYTRLREPDPAAEIRLTTFLTTFVETHQRDFSALERELPNITRAVEIAVARKLDHLLLTGVFALFPFLEARHLTTLAETMLGYAQDAAHTLDDQHSLIRVRLFVGNVAELRGDYPHAQQAYLEGLALARQNGFPDLVAQLVILTGRTLVNLGDTGVQTEAYLIEGLQALDEWEGDAQHASRCVIFQHLGELADNRGEEEHATRFYHQGLLLARATQQWYTASALLQNVGVKAARRGEYSLARAYYQEGLQYAQQINNLQRQSALLMNMGMLAWHQEDKEEAIALSEESLRLARQIEHRMRISSVLQNLGMMMRVCKHLAQAATYLTESLELAKQIEHHWLITETLGEWGLLYLAEHHVTQARQAFEEMQARAEAMEAPLLVASARFGFAQVAAQEGLRTEALRLVRESHDLFLHLNHVLGLQEIERWIESCGLNSVSGSVPET